MNLAGDVAERYFAPSTSQELAKPVLWSKNRLDAYLWRAQRRIMHSIRDNRYTAVPSCHDSGKSYTAMVATSWWLDPRVHPVGDAFVVSTAPTGAQVSAVLWREIERMHRKRNLIGHINMGTMPEWRVNKELIAYGRKPADHSAVGFQGIHAKYVLVVVDEAAGVPKALWDAVDSLATNRHARVLAIGNPDDASSHFRTICQPGSGWNVIRIDGLRTPNFTEESVRRFPHLYRYMQDHNIPFATEPIPEAIRDFLLSVEWVEERMKRWGVNLVVDDETGAEKWTTSALWEAKVRGQFPTDATEGVIPLGWVEAANRRYVEFVSGGGDFDGIPGRRIFGADIARFGDDETSIATAQGLAILKPPEQIGNQDTMTTAKRLLAKLRSAPTSVAGVDVIGVGAGVVDRLREEGANVTAFNASERTDMTDATGEFTFNNTRSASWWHLRELLDPSRDAKLMLPPDEELTTDLCAPRWKIAPGAKIVVEPKDEIKKRIGRSPDRGDAVCICFWPWTNVATAGSFAAAQYGGQSQYGARWGGDNRVYAYGGEVW